MYADDNHKPEMALAITDFEALCGFESYEGIASVLAQVPELTELLGEAVVQPLTHPGSATKEVRMRTDVRVGVCAQCWYIQLGCSWDSELSWCSMQSAAVTQKPHITVLAATPCTSFFTQHLRAAFTALMTSNPERVGTTVESLVSRLQSESSSSGGRQLSAKEALAIRLHQQYPKDVGVLSSFFLNLVRFGMGVSQNVGVG